MTKFFLIVLAAATLAACGAGTPKQINIARAQVSEEHPVLGTLVVSAPPGRSLFSSVNRSDIYLDDQLLGTLSDNTTLTAQVEPGIHRMHVVAGLVASYRADQKVFGVDPGQTVHYSYEVKSSSAAPIFGASGVVMSQNNKWGFVLISK